MSIIDEENRNSKRFNEDGTLKCFGKAGEFNDEHFEGRGIHCAEVFVSGDCNEQLKRECLKRSAGVIESNFDIQLWKHRIEIAQELEFLADVEELEDLHRNSGKW